MATTGAATTEEEDAEDAEAEGEDDEETARGSEEGTEDMGRSESMSVWKQEAEEEVAGGSREKAARTLVTL